MITTYQISKKMDLLLRREISLDDFEEWLATHSWNTHMGIAVEAQRLVSSIELCLAKYATDLIDQGLLREELRKLIEKGE